VGMTQPGARDIEAFIHRSFTPDEDGPPFAIEHVDAKRARLRLVFDTRHLRPGASISGPSQMALADTAAWTLVLHNLGFEFASSVTSNLNMNFLLRPKEADLIAEASVLRLGSRSSVSEVRLFSAGDPAPVAHATVTYALLKAKDPRA
jgi:uncharacterized protein (TIGR00369 family)